MKLVIDKSKWLRGEGYHLSKLHRPHDGRMCCLGFLGTQLGIEQADLSDYGSPAYCPAQGAFPEWLFRADPSRSGGRPVTNSELACKLMSTNDDETLTDGMREDDIAWLLATVGVEVEFVDGSSGRHQIERKD